MNDNDYELALRQSKETVEVLSFREVDEVPLRISFSGLVEQTRQLW